MGLAAMNQGLQVTIQIFVRVEFRGVGGQEEHLDVFRVLFQPAPNLVAVVHSQVVQNQEHLAPGIPNQACQESNQHRGCHCFPIEHEANFPLIGDRGDHVRGESTAGHSLNRCLTRRRIAPAMLAVATDTRFVAPVNLRPFILGALGNARVTFLEPSFHQFRFLLVGLLQRLLRCETPAFKILADRPNRHIDLETTMDQLLHRRPCPECKGQLELVRHLLADQLLYRPLLFYAQGATLSDLLTSLAALYR